MKKIIIMAVVALSLIFVQLPIAMEPFQQQKAENIIDTDDFDFDTILNNPHKSQIEQNTTVYCYATIIYLIAQLTNRIVNSDEYQRLLIPLAHDNEKIKELGGKNDLFLSNSKVFLQDVKKNIDKYIEEAKLNPEENNNLQKIENTINKINSLQMIDIEKYLNLIENNTIKNIANNADIIDFNIDDLEFVKLLVQIKN